jgi:hypothetical protein
VARARLSALHVVVEQIRAIGETLCCNAVPAFYFLPNKDVPQQDFIVWRGTETMTDEVRAALTIGFWPGPPSTPSPQRLLSEPGLRRFVAVTLFGGPEHTPWEALWRERLVRHGLYGVFISPAGRMGVMLASRGVDDPPFTEADVAFVEACAPYVEKCLDLEKPAVGGVLTPADDSQLRFDEAGRIAAMSFAGREMLRDAAGGGPGALPAAIAIVEKANALHSSKLNSDPASFAELTLAGLGTERAFRTSMFDLAARPGNDPDRTGAAMVLADLESGRYVLRLSTLVSMSGGLERIGVVTRYIPPLLLQIRGAFKAQASAREIQLICALEAHPSLKEAARSMNIAKATARTLGERLAARVLAPSLPDALARLGEIGRTAWRTEF